MSSPHEPQPSPARQKFIARLYEIPIKSAAHDYYIRWAESWTKARGHHSAQRTRDWFDALGRSSIADWQLRQAIDAARILASDIMKIEWATSFDWQALSDQAKSLEPDHRTRARETITVRADLPPPCDPASLPDTHEEVARITDALRRAIRLKNMAMATEETYVHWCARFTRFCLSKLKNPPHITRASPSSQGDRHFITRGHITRGQTFYKSITRGQTFYKRNTGQMSSII